MTVTRQEQADARRLAERINDASDCGDIWCEGPARLCEPAAATEERTLRQPADIAVGHNVHGADLIIHVRDRHPCDVDKRRDRPPTTRPSINTARNVPRPMKRSAFPSCSDSGRETGIPIARGRCGTSDPTPDTWPGRDEKDKASHAAWP